jgi:hypothetical protein
MRTLRPVLVLIIAAVVAATGCTRSRSPAPHASATPPGSPVPSSSPSPMLPAVTDDPPPDGQSVLTDDGRGPKDFVLTALANRKSHVTIRLACIGEGPATLTDRAAGIVLQIGGCVGKGVCSAEFTSAPSDQTVHLSVGPRVEWRIGVWAS